ncbi:cohesin complex subunit psm1 [Ceraceosorus bombacis]|uniref:Structural maintenance of chromosomes protein n=1 Tax=Ceraceosorus bombacis TaxID=401625 RepID=A0A0P1BRY4_9BASI|nr:cohesin complex subunit psm1 [Ceraceosorus bombacis]
MPLVQLEVENFKSYRGKQIIGPFNSFTAIIGPNGSGKSNLMDAVSFVLGVKSAQLRSSQLKDLIYRGRKMAREEGDEEAEALRSDEEDEGEGTAGKASVSAVYRDKQGAEWRFTRNITSSGASEYRVNNKVHSWNSYNDRLRSFNILVKAKNFLVFQGDVEAVAQQGPKELSRLIDQISGSLEYKEAYEAAKAAQDRAIEQSTYSFNKRRGINGELKTYREQKSEAEKWERLQSERDAHILQHILWRLYHIEEELEQTSSTIDSESSKLPQLRKQVRDEESHVEQARKEVAQLDKDIAKQESSLRKRERELEALQPSIGAIDEKIAHSNRRRTNAEELCVSVERDVERLTARIAKLRRDHDSAKDAADEAAEEQRRAAQERGQALSGQELAEYHELKAQANLRATAERQQLETLSRDIRANKATADELDEKLKALQRAKEKQEAISESQKERKQALEGRARQVEKSLKDARNELTRVQKQRADIVKREDELNKTLEDCVNKLLQAGSDARETEREMRMKETYAALARMFPGVHGRLADLCKPVQRKYDTAISTVLGRNNDALIVDNEKTAIDCIEYLRSQRAGQATFIPLDTIQVKPINDRLRNIASGARLAVDVLQFDAAVERAMHFACGNAVVCDSMPIARFVCYEKKVEVKAVTLDGTLIHKSGNITGGVTAGERTHRWEEREVDGLGRQRDQCLAELKELGKQRYELSQDDDLRSSLQRSEADLSTLRDELTEVNSRLDGARDELKIINSQIKDTTGRFNKARTAQQDAENRATGLMDTVEGADDAVFGAFCQRIGVPNIRAYEARQLRVLEQQSQARLKYEEQMKRLDHQIRFEERQLADAEERLELNRRVITKEAERVQARRAEKEELEAQIQELQERIEQVNERLAELREQQQQRLKALSEAKKNEILANKTLGAKVTEISRCNDVIEKLSAERSSIYRRCRLEEIDLPLKQGSLSSIPLEDNPDLAPMDIDEDVTQRAIEAADYGIEVDFTDLDDEEKADGGEDMAKELQGRIDDVIAQIEQMQPNMKAIERLDDAELKLKETEKEFARSRNDAQKARDEFNRIKKKRCDLFNAAFSHISERIDSTYKELTKGKASPMGGVAYLSLEDSDEPYLSGVRYHIMPPMKRFRDMSDLSGGEKTIGALALLFAISTFRAPPLWILDEVDAALDSTNVSRVANYLRSHASDQTQFIVISLKASMYERASSLCGIYRQQDINSSRSLTLDLDAYA